MPGRLQEVWKVTNSIKYLKRWALHDFDIIILNDYETPGQHETVKKPDISSRESRAAACATRDFFIAMVSMSKISTIEIKENFKKQKTNSSKN